MRVSRLGSGEGQVIIRDRISDITPLAEFDSTSHVDDNNDDSLDRFRNSWDTNFPDPSSEWDDNIIHHGGNEFDMDYDETLDRIRESEASDSLLQLRQQDFVGTTTVPQMGLSQRTAASTILALSAPTPPTPPLEEEESRHKGKAPPKLNVGATAAKTNMIAVYE